MDDLWTQTCLISKSPRTTLIWRHSLMSFGILLSRRGFPFSKSRTLIFILIFDLIFPYFRSIMPPVIDLNDHRFYRLVTLSNKLAAPVLRRVIKQYCDVHGLTFEDVLDFYKHELFHFWHGARAGCCKCNNKRFNRVLLDKQWHTLFTDISASLPATHAHSGHDAKGCPEVFIARPWDRCRCVWHFSGFFFINKYNGENNNNPCGWSNNKHFHCNWFEHQRIARVHSRSTLTPRCEWLWTISVETSA